jgi:hypothetical protein
MFVRAACPAWFDDDIHIDIEHIPIIPPCLLLLENDMVMRRVS